MFLLLLFWRFGCAAVAVKTESASSVTTAATLFQVRRLVLVFMSEFPLTERCVGGFEKGEGGGRKDEAADRTGEEEEKGVEVFIG